MACTMMQGIPLTVGREFFRLPPGIIIRTNTYTLMTIGAEPISLRMNVIGAMVHATANASTLLYGTPVQILQSKSRTTKQIAYLVGIDTSCIDCVNVRSDNVPRMLTMNLNISANKRLQLIRC